MHNETTIFIIQSYVVSELLSIKDQKMSLSRKQPQAFDPVHDATKGLSMWC